MQTEGYGAAIYIFELQAHIPSSSPRFLLLRCCEVLLFYRLVFIFKSTSGACFLVSSGLKTEAKCKKDKMKESEEKEREREAHVK